MYVYRAPSKDFNCKENLVLKELLRVIYEIIFIKIKLKTIKQHDWFQKWVTHDVSLEKLEDIYTKNVYARQIDIENHRVTDKMIEQVQATSRDDFYKNVAKLLAKYRSIKRLEDVGAVREMLQRTFIQPKSHNTLFELYWVFKMIKHYRAEAKLHIIETGNNLIASWDNSDYRFALFHNSIGSGLLSFRVTLDDIKNSNHEYLERMLSRYEINRKLTYGFFGERKSNSLWGGRPDLVLEIVRKDDHSVAKIIIGEVKYSTNVDTAKRGLEELLSYIAFVKNHGVYLNSMSCDDDKIQGILFLDNVEGLEKNRIDNISVVTCNNSRPWP